jgi:chaperonin GroEL
MAKKVFYDDDARRRVLAGAEILYNAVKTTMGPKGRNVVISRDMAAPTVTHDGVTVAKSIELPEADDETLGYKVGAEMIKQAASKMNDVAGDGTTTVTVLTYHILSEANKLIAAGHSPMELRKELELAAMHVIAGLEASSIDINGKKNLKRVEEIGTISAGDPEIGALIAEVIAKVGADGVVTVEESQGMTLESEIVKGFEFDRGFISSFMVTDTERNEAVYQKPAIIISDRKVNSFSELVPLLEKLMSSGKKDVVFIVDDLLGDTLPNLVINRLKGAFNSVAIKTPGYGESRSDVLEDLAILTGAQVISEELGMTFENVELDVVGAARSVIVTKSHTTIVEGAGSPTALKKRLGTLTDQIREKGDVGGTIERRKAALSNKVAVIKVGGTTETEVEEKKYRVDDAVAAVKAALSEGIVPGGGIALVNQADRMQKLVTNGASLLRDALIQPFRILMSNSGINADEWLPVILKSKTGQGINVNQPTSLVDMMAIGVIDPARVTKEAVKSAVSIAGTVMTMGALIVDIPEKETQHA